MTDYQRQMAIDELIELVYAAFASELSEPDSDLAGEVRARVRRVLHLLGAPQTAPETLHLWVA